MSEERKIAIIDDHTMFRKGLAVLINMFPGYRVVSDSGNGKEFIDALRADELPDIVLLDVSMPEMDGYQTANWIASSYPEMRILALSTMEAEMAIIRMIRNGARGYVLKDANPSVLKIAFDDLMSIGYYYNDVVSVEMRRSLDHPASPKAGTAFEPRISKREMEFLHAVCSEKTYRQIAQEMFLSERTIDGYRESLFEKLGVASRVGLVIYAIRNKLVTIS
jgi:DNA-binding NarL/FixJ family response regulator